MSAQGGGGTAIAGAAQAVGVEQVVPVLQQVTQALTQVVAALQAGNGSASGGGAAPADGGCGMSGCSPGARGGGAQGAPAAAPAPAPSTVGGGGTSDFKAPKHDEARQGSNDARHGAANAQGAGASGPADKAKIDKWVTGDKDGLNPVLLDRLAQLGERMGTKVSITSGFRTRAEQEELYRKYKNGTGNLAAKPGTSNHESGNAADASVGGVSLRDSPEAKRIAAELGLVFPVPSESWHVELKK